MSEACHARDPLVLVGLHSSGGQECPPSLVHDALKAFNGSVAWGCANGEGLQRGTDIVFAEAGEDLALVGIANPESGQVTDWLHVLSVTPSESLLADLLTTILAPSFAPGLVGVDWDDVEALLKTGGLGLLAVCRGMHQIAIGQARRRIDEALRNHGSPPIAGVLGVLISTAHQIHMSDLKTLFVELHDMRPGDDYRTIGAAAIRVAGEPHCALLAVLGAREWNGADI